MFHKALYLTGVGEAGSGVLSVYTADSEFRSSKNKPTVTTKRR